MERGRANGLLRPSTGVTKDRPWGGLICHPAGGPPYQQERNTVFVSRGIQAVETTGVSTWRAGADGGGSVLLWWPPRAETKEGTRDSSKVPTERHPTSQVLNPWEGWRECSVERSLANVRGSHQKALAMAAVLEKEVEWLSFPPLGVSLSSEHTPEVETARYMDPGGRKGGTTRCGLRAAWPPTLNITLPKGTQSPAERWWLLKTLNWRSHQNWGQRSPASSKGWLRAQKRRKKHPLPNPQWRSSIGGWLGKLKLVKHLANGESCWQYQRCKTVKR